MAYVSMAIKLDSPSRRQERILNERLRTGERPNEDRVPPFMTRKDLVAATTTLGTRVSKIVECQIEKEIERKKVGTQTLNRQDAVVIEGNDRHNGCMLQLVIMTRVHMLYHSEQHYHGAHVPAVNKNSNQPRKLNASDDEYLPWNAAVREFHADVLKALQPVNDHLARTIMENIPIKWIPAVDEEALEAAKMAILKADPPAQF
ncbi:hypothetical protein NCS56_01259600 [Fusarium sp. Ph1]|nr:hypothetical protein NCS56_01259600 [Fusarium sp. Ph1]